MDPVACLPLCSQVNDTHFFLAGGVNDMGWNNPRVWMYSFQSQKWAELPKMILPRSGRDRAASTSYFFFFKSTGT